MSEFLVFQFEFADRGLEPEDSGRDAFDRVGDFRLIAGSEVLFEDSAFPLDRLAIALGDWLEGVRDQPQAFSFHEAGAAVPPVLRIFPGAEGWHFASIQREFASPLPFALDPIIDAATQFIVELRNTAAKSG